MASTKMQMNCEIVLDGTDIFVVSNGRRIAKRGEPDSAQRGTWLALEPGWTVRGGHEIEVTFEPPAAQ